MSLENHTYKSSIFTYLLCWRHQLTPSPPATCCVCVCVLCVHKAPCPAVVWTTRPSFLTITSLSLNQRSLPFPYFYFPLLHLSFHYLSWYPLLPSPAPSVMIGWILGAAGKWDAVSPSQPPPPSQRRRGRAQPVQRWRGSVFHPVHYTPGLPAGPGGPGWKPSQVTSQASKNRHLEWISWLG